MSVGVMEDYKLRVLRASHTLVVYCESRKRELNWVVFRHKLCTGSGTGDLFKRDMLCDLLFHFCANYCSVFVPARAVLVQKLNNI
jgi:hypothetical protein